MKSLKNLSLQLHSVLGDLYMPVAAIFKILVIAVISVIAVKIGSFIIRKIFDKQKSFKYRINNKRIDTISTLTRSIYKYAIYTIASITILTDIFNLKSVIAAAGVGGLAIGFGAQSLIKDIISGFFIIFEDQFGVGDVVTIEGMNGTVEDMELRVTRVRNMNGDLYVIPNGEIKKVTNHSRGNKTAIVDIPLSYDADINKAFEIASIICEAVSKEFETIVEAPTVMGITGFTKEGMSLRITAKTLPNEHWEVERRIRKLIKEEFAKAKIELFGKSVIIIEKDSHGGDSGAR
jgi:small conductance mechanosensitive channel